MAELTLVNVSKRYGATVAVDDVSLTIPRGEFISLLGPSGCGKTTTLQIVAGFIAPQAGTVLIDGKVANDIPPHRRDIGMVFQNYALFPHMTVQGNVEFGLKMRKVPPPERVERVAGALRLVRLEGLQGRYPHQLSGGQQQRVALARALVINPTVLLLDEPLSNLDAKLRVETREEIRRLQQHLGVTTIFVTHDQEEAMTMSDRIAVMNAGRIEQLGTPEELYNRPRTTFVAGFIGSSNLLPGRVERVAGPEVAVALDGYPMLVQSVAGDQRLAAGQAVHVLIRPERMTIAAGSDGHGVNRFRGRIEFTIYVGAVTKYSIQLDGGLRLHAEIPNLAEGIRRTGEEVSVAWSPRDTVVIPDGARDEC